MIEMSPEIESHRKELQTAVAAVMTAGGVILDQVDNHQAERYGLEFKAAVDLLADEAGTKIIRETFPDDAILTEEQGVPEQLASRLWVADLLDGTTNFLNGSRNYSVLLGFVENGKLVLGVSFLPATNELFYAVKGEGAYLNGQKIHVSRVDSLKRANVALDAGYDPNGGEKSANLLVKLRPQVGNVAMYNANGYTLCMLAKGELGGYDYCSSSKIWEAAGHLLVQEAGGKITDMEGQELKLNFTSPAGFAFIASNGLIHEELINAVR